MPGLERFLKAQKETYDTALQEIRSGKKTSHWMWFIFPQIAGLGFSETSRYYAIKDVAEAQEFLLHPILGNRLFEITNALLMLPGNDALTIFGSPDNLKLKSCMTLFSQLPQADVLFQKILDKFFNGEKDSQTIHLMSAI